MNSRILRTATRLLITLLLMFSAFLLIRGHHEPGGGFVGGLVAAAALALYALAYDATAARRLVRVEPRALVATGLAVAAASGAVASITGAPFLTGQWRTVELPGLVPVTVGTPLLFDLGVYLTVLGTVLTIILALAEE